MSSQLQKKAAALKTGGGKGESSSAKSLTGLDSSEVLSGLGRSLDSAQREVQKQREAERQRLRQTPSRGCGCGGGW